PAEGPPPAASRKTFAGLATEVNESAPSQAAASVRAWARSGVHQMAGLLAACLAACLALGVYLGVSNLVHGAVPAVAEIAGTVLTGSNGALLAQVDALDEDLL